VYFSEVFVLSFDFANKLLLVMKKGHYLRFLVLPLLFLVSCSNPRDTPLPKDLSNIETIKPSLDKLSPEERGFVAGYIMRHTIGAAFGSAFGVKADPIPDGMTIGKAINEQKEFIEKQKSIEAAKKLEKEKADAARKVLADQMAKVLTVRLIDIQLHKATYSNFDVNNSINLTFSFENKGLKTITGLKGIATFKDKFGDLISELPIKVDQEIQAGKSVTISLSKNFNQFDSGDRNLASLEAAKTNFSISPEVILFSDGTKFDVTNTQNK